MSPQHYTEKQCCGPGPTMPDPEISTPCKLTAVAHSWHLKPDLSCHSGAPAGAVRGKMWSQPVSELGRAHSDSSPQTHPSDATAECKQGGCTRRVKSPHSTHSRDSQVSATSACEGVCPVTRSLSALRKNARYEKKIGLSSANTFPNHWNGHNFLPLSTL